MYAVYNRIRFSQANIFTTIAAIFSLFTTNINNIFSDFFQSFWSNAINEICKSSRTVELFTLTKSVLTSLKYTKHLACLYSF